MIASIYPLKWGIKGFRQRVTLNPVLFGSVIGFYVCPVNGFISPVYYFLVTAVTNYHKPGGFKQQEFILPQFWRPEFCSLADLSPSGGPGGESLSCCCFQHLGIVSLILWPHFRALSPHCLFSVSGLELLLLLYGYVWLHLRPTWIIPDWVLLSHPLIACIAI